jgi:hypothetical protein
MWTSLAHLQRGSLQSDCVMKIAGGEAGQSVAPVEIAGCYAPGGRSVCTRVDSPIRMFCQMFLLTDLMFVGGLG